MVSDTQTPAGLQYTRYGCLGRTGLALLALEWGDRIKLNIRRVCCVSLLNATQFVFGPAFYFGPAVRTAATLFLVKAEGRRSRSS